MIRHFHNKYIFKYFSLLITVTFLAACGPNIPEEMFNQDIFYVNGQYTERSIMYFLQVGFCSDFDPVCFNPIIRKWTSDIHIQLHGNYNESDEIELDKIIIELSTLTGLSIRKVGRNANINIYFVAQDQFKRHIKEYNENNPQDGLFSVQSINGTCYKATICIEDNSDQLKKHHLLREELTQSLGLMKDSEWYIDSIFQENPFYKPTQYSNIDKAVIRLMYDEKIKPGMSPEQVTETLKTTSVQTAGS